MEFAVSAIFILVLLLPGFILQSAYTKGLWRWNSPTSAWTLTEQIPAAVVLASVLHVLWATLAAGIRKLSDDQTPGEEVESDDNYYHIEGDYFVLRYSEMCTINIDYIFVTPESDLEPDDAALVDVN